MVFVHISCRCTQSMLIIRHAPHTAEYHCICQKTKRGLTPCWWPTGTILCLRQSPFILVSVSSQIQKSVVEYLKCFSWKVMFVSTVPVSLSSFEVFSTTTTAHLTWKLRRQQSISTLTLYNVETSSFLKVFDINFSDTEYTLKSLQPGTQFRAVVTASVSTRQSGITVNQELSFYLKTGNCAPRNATNLIAKNSWRFLVPANCPREWLANMRSCYSVRTSALSWHDSQCSCKELAPGAHLADMKSWEDLLFVSSHLLTNDNLLLLWTGLNDQQVTSHSFGKHAFLL